MFETTFELVSPLSPADLAARFRSEFFAGQAECKSFWSCYDGQVDEQGFKLIIKGRVGAMAHGTFESGDPTRVRVTVDRYIGAMFIGTGLFLAMAVAAVLWVFWDDWRHGRFTDIMVPMLIGITVLSLAILPLCIVLSSIRYRGVKSKLTRLFVPDEGMAPSS